MKKLFAVMHYDYEDADYSDVEFVGNSTKTSKYRKLILNYMNIGN